MPLKSCTLTNLDNDGGYVYAVEYRTDDEIVIILYCETQQPEHLKDFVKNMLLGNNFTWTINTTDGYTAISLSNGVYRHSSCYFGDGVTGGDFACPMNSIITDAWKKVVDEIDEM